MVWNWIDNRPPVRELVRVECPVCKRTWLTNKISHEQCPHDQCGEFYQSELFTSWIIIEEKGEEVKK